MFARIRSAKLGGFVAAVTSPAGHDCLRDPGQPGGPSGVRALSEQLSHASLNPKQDLTVTGSGEEDFVVNKNAKILCGNVQTANATVYFIRHRPAAGSLSRVFA